jgi:hypothetical protein
MEILVGLLLLKIQGEKIMDYKKILFLAIFLFPQQGISETVQPTPSSKGQVYDIPTGEQAPSGIHPFFADSPSYEIAEKVEELEERLKAMEAQIAMKDGNTLVKSQGGASIHLQGPDIILTAPGKVKIEAKDIQAPALRK